MLNFKVFNGALGRDVFIVVYETEHPFYADLLLLGPPSEMSSAFLVGVVFLALWWNGNVYGELVELVINQFRRWPIIDCMSLSGVGSTGVGGLLLIDQQ